MQEIEVLVPLASVGNLSEGDIIAKLVEKDVYFVEVLGWQKGPIEGNKMKITVQYDCSADEG